MQSAHKAECSPLTPCLLARCLGDGRWYTEAEIAARLEGHIQPHHGVRASGRDPSLAGAETHSRYLAGAAILVRQAIKNALRRKLMEARREKGGFFRYRFKEIDPETLARPVKRTKLRPCSVQRVIYEAIRATSGIRKEELCAKLIDILTGEQAESAYLNRLRRRRRDLSEEQIAVRMDAHHLLPGFRERIGMHYLGMHLSNLKRTGKITVADGCHFVREQVGKQKVAKANRRAQVVKEEKCKP
jgi:hypothetical protein